MNYTDTQSIVITIVLAIIVYTYIKYHQKKKRIKAKKEEQQNSDIIPDLTEIEQAYQSKWMFTMNEKNIFYALEKIVEGENLRLFAKVRLFDLIAPIKNHPKYKTNLYKIQAKHVDFVITKQNLVAKYIIELDDSSHNTPERKERDVFVDAVLQSCGYKVLHIRGIEEDIIRAFLHS